MANLIQFKTRLIGGAAGAPTTMSTGEPAYNAQEDILYVGADSTVNANAAQKRAIAGAGAVLMLLGVQSVSGIKTFSGGIRTGETVPANDASTIVPSTAWVQALLTTNISGQSYKTAARAGSSANVVLTGPGTTVGGVTLAASDRFLAYGQTAKAENGIYVFNGAAAAATRAPDADTAGKIRAATLFVTEGTDADKQFHLQTDAITLGTTALTFVQTGSSSGGATIVSNAGVAGAAIGVSITSGTLTLRKLIGTAGTGSAAGVTATQNVDDVTLAYSGVANYGQGGTGVDLGTLTTGALLKKGATSLAAAVAGTDYLDGNSPINGGTY